MLGRYDELGAPGSLVIRFPCIGGDIFTDAKTNRRVGTPPTSKHGCGLFAPNLLQRQKATTSQAGLNHAQRKQNLARAFYLNESGKAAVRDQTYS